ncbi:acyl-CoA reductase-like NAD-dependent aldehyde dehydrogenase [Bacillus pakistanensis]|uniref:Acyl-CoA reductase-like NAD-dependent aldehyde dehydrogenase n=1 Tax=Rossellomorea pakistanensis TaxID=992288 RepID=A0ABS2N8Q7_9BACI|nr:aldehyde dehydrogenase family protein [Bacillus pakistanensis]MBM7584234.1 acyl-CoA reductase-like NAD-dependent aldehyde dehydrogenase [Bacillus pakistanensis]
MKQHLWINGEAIEAKEYTDLLSPYSRKKIAKIAKANENHVVEAIYAAKEAFESSMKTMPAYKRAEILENVVELLKIERESCAEIICQEASKPMQAALVEVDRTIMTYSFAAQEARRIYGESIPMDAAPGGEERVAYTVKEPLGVIGAITPFNFPMNLVAHKVGPAIAAGNTVVLKPASQTPLSAYKIAKIFHKAGLPAGALNVVTGSGNEVGTLLTRHKDISMLTFTGSPEVGKSIREKAGLKKVTLELGSNSAVIVDKGTSLNDIIPKMVKGAFAFQGQVCISIQRIFVHEDLKDEFIQQYVDKTSKLKLGDPMNLETDVSAMISPYDADRVLKWIEEAVHNGAKLVHGGEKQGSILYPTVLVDVALDQKISCEEVFAPVVHINSFQDWDEAIDKVNDSQYGLQAGVFTNNVQNAFKATKELHVGGVMVNEIPTFRVDHMPYGGVKMSGMGREGIKYAVEEMTELKLISFKL